VFPNVSEHPRRRLLDQGGQGRTEGPIIYTAAAAHLTLTVPSFTRKEADGVVVVRAGGISATATAAAYFTPFPSFFWLRKRRKIPVKDLGSTKSLGGGKGCARVSAIRTRCWKINWKVFIDFFFFFC
jgi:hypothetical protein